MTKKVLAQIRAIDAAAEKAGRYVANPSALKHNPEGEKEFATIRSYSLQHNKPISSLTKDDYARMGLHR